MAVIDELLRSESNGNISFGNHELAAKAKLEDYEHAGDLYKVKTYQAMTKLEKMVCFYMNQFRVLLFMTFVRARAACLLQ